MLAQEYISEVLLAEDYIPEVLLGCLPERVADQTWGLVQTLESP